MALNSNSTHNLAVTQETHTKTKRYVVLNNGSLAEVPDGVKPEDTLRLENRKLASRQAKENGAAKRTSRTSRSQNSRRTNYAKQVVARTVATLELVNRVNKPEAEQDTIFVNGEVMYV